jgi:hypothetical protein
MKLIYLVVGGLLIAMISACSSPSHAADPPPAPAPSTVPANPYAVPQVITVAYVNSVLKALNHVYGNAERQLAATHEVNPDVADDLRSIFNDPAYEGQIQASELSLQRGIIANVRPNGGDAATVVDRLVTATPTCIFIQTSTDPSALFLHPVAEPASEYFELAPKQPDADPQKLNPTPWAYADDEVFLTRTMMTSKCASQ